MIGTKWAGLNCYIVSPLIHCCEAVWTGGSIAGYVLTYSYTHAAQKASREQMDVQEVYRLSQCIPGCQKKNQMQCSVKESAAMALKESVLCCDDKSYAPEATEKSGKKFTI